MTVELAFRLLASGTVTREQLERCLLEHAERRVPLPQALASSGAVTAGELEDELARCALPTSDILEPDMDRVAQLPPGICSALLAVPVRAEPPSDDLVHLAVGNPFDRHAAEEMRFQLGTDVRIVRAPLTWFASLIDRLGRAEAAFGATERSTLRFEGGSETTLDAPSASPLPERRSATTAPAPSTSASDVPIPLVPRNASPRLMLVGDEPDDIGFLDDFMDFDPGFDPSPISQVRNTQEGFFADPGARPPSSLHEPPSAGSLHRPSLQASVDAIAQANRVPAITSAIVEALLPHARHVCVFAVRRDAFCGWACSPSMGPVDVFQSIRIPKQVPSALAEAERHGWYLGPLVHAEAHAGLTRLLGESAVMTVVVAVRVGDRSAMLIVAAGVREPERTIHTAQVLGQAASTVLARLMHRGGPPQP